MAYITREDGERFVIPSYRDVISAKKTSLLKREILLLASSYGEYITLQKKSSDQYEVAFSPDTGYLLGESIWHYFKRPMDLVYCEAIPNTQEAILVIVKSGSVYLDGSFPIDAIPDELLIFRTQKNQFEVYIHGDVPISQTPEEGKFSFDSSSVKSFSVLEKPVFPTLPTLRAFQLQLVDVVLSSQGIGVFPIKPILAGIVVLGLLWMAWMYLTTYKKELPRVIVGVVNPYQLYNTTLASPDPANEVRRVVLFTKLLYTMPGWSADGFTYQNGAIETYVHSRGARTNVLYYWAFHNRLEVIVKPDGYYLAFSEMLWKRPAPQTINRIQEVISTMVDRLSYVIPGDNLKVGAFTDRRVFLESDLTISFASITSDTLDLVGQQLKNLPLVMKGLTVKIDSEGLLSGTMVLTALGN